MKITIFDLNKACNIAKRIKPEYVRLKSIKGKTYMFFAKEPCLMGFEFSHETQDVFDLVINAGALIYTLSTLSKGSVFADCEIDALKMVLKSGKNKVTFMALGDNPDEFVKSPEMLFKMEGDVVNIIADIATSYSTIGLQKESVIGWQMATDRKGRPFCVMSDRTIISVRYLDGIGDPKEPLIEIPDVAADLLNQIHGAYIANTKAKNWQESAKAAVKSEKSQKLTVELPDIYINDKYVGYPFTDQIAFIVMAQSQENPFDAHKALEVATQESFDKYTLSGASLVTAFKSVEGFDGKFVTFLPDKTELTLVFENSYFKNEKTLGKSVETLDEQKFTVSYPGLKSIVGKLKPTDDITLAFRYQNDRTKAIVLKRANAVDVIICGVG